MMAIVYSMRSAAITLGLLGATVAQTHQSLQMTYAYTVFGATGSPVEIQTPFGEDLCEPYVRGGWN